MYKRIGGLYSLSFDARVVSSLITFYEYYARLISIYTMPVFKHNKFINLLWKVKLYSRNVVREGFNLLNDFVFIRFNGILKSILFLYYNYSSEIKTLRSNPRALPYSKVSSLFNLTAYLYLNLNNRFIDIYQSDKEITANK